MSLTISMKGAASDPLPGSQKSQKETVARLLKLSGRHAQRFHDQEVCDLTPRALEFDEQWSFEKKQKNCAENERDEVGDFWDHTAVTADSKLLLSLVVGRRTKDRTHELVGDAQSRLRTGHLPVLLSGGYEGYAPPSSMPLVVATRR